MTVCLVDTAISGHHSHYINALTYCLRENGVDYFTILPSDFRVAEGFILDSPVKLNFVQYFFARKNWLKKVSQIISREKPHIVHFLSGDSLYQLGGIGMSSIADVTENIVITQHHVPLELKRKYLFKRFAKYAKKIVIHTEMNNFSLQSLGVPLDKLTVIDYPIFHQTSLSLEESRRRVNLSTNLPVLLSIGGTRYDKGLDILLEALSYIQNKFLFLIVGKEEFFTENFIREKLKKISKEVILRLGVLSDDEFGWYCDAVDCIVLPYRKIFDGASGPMTEAVWRRKPVIGPSHGSLGNLIEKNDLGYTFEAENPLSLASTIDRYVANINSFQWSELAEKYREKIALSTFKDQYFSLFQSLS